MLTVENGYVLFATPPARHIYHFVDTPTPIQRSIPSASAWPSDPPQATTTTGYSLYIGYGALGKDLCTYEDYTFYNGSVSHRIYNGSEIYGGIRYYYLMENENSRREYGLSTVPIKFYIKSNDVSAYFDSAGNIHYRGTYLWIDYLRIDDDTGMEVYNTWSGDFIRNYDAELMTMGKPQNELLHTVSGS